MSDTVLTVGTTSSISFSKPSKKSAIGVSFIHDEDGVKVSEVKEGGLAEQAGLKVGDTVQTINGNKVSKSYTAAKMIRDSKTIDITKTSFEVPEYFLKEVAEEKADEVKEAAEDAATEAMPGIMTRYIMFKVWVADKFSCCLGKPEMPKSGLLG